MPSFLSTTITIATLAIANSIQGTHQLALRRMSVNVLLGAMKVSTTRSAWESGGCSTGATGLAELMGLLLLQTKYGCRPCESRRRISLRSNRNSARFRHPGENQVKKELMLPGYDRHSSSDKEVWR